MPRMLTILRHMLRALGSAVISFAVWTVWLALVVVFGFQVYIATTNELAIPDWLLRSIEQRLQASGVNAKFGRTSFDPTGTLFFEQVSLELPSLREPVLTASGIFVRLDPWALLNRRFAPSEFRVTDANLLVPAMLSPSGQTAPLVRDFNLVLRPGNGGALTIEALNARLGNLSVNARGTIYLPPRATTSLSPQRTGELIASRYAAACRQLLAAVEKTAKFEEPSAEVTLVPSESGIAIATLNFTARAVKLDTPLAVTGTGLKAVARFPLLGNTPVTVDFEFTADEFVLPREVRARSVRAELRGSLNPATFAFEPSTLELAADRLTGEGIETTSFVGHFTTAPVGKIQAEIAALAMGASLGAKADIDFEAKTVALRFAGRVAPGWLDVVSRRVGRDVRRFVDFEIPIRVEDARVTIGAGWKFENLRADIEARSVDAYRVPIDAASGHVELTPKRFLASNVRVRLGDNFATGSYEHAFGTKEFRFLLEGRAAPLDLSGWFGPWWPNFFKDFQFPALPPDTSVDVSGRWGEGRLTTVFLFADAKSPVIRGAKLDRARTLLFIRPGFYDGLEAYGTSGSGVARGTFRYQLDPETFAWKQFDFDGVSSIDLDVAGQLIGEISTDWLRPFKFATPPDLKVIGRLERRGADDYRQEVRIEGRSAGALRFQGFPLERPRFTATLRDDEISVEEVEAGFAGGTTKGHAKISGRGAKRGLAFDVALQEASLGQTVATLEEFLAEKNGTPATARSNSIQEKNNVRLDLAATAEGELSNLLSYQGRGVAELKGVELGEVRLLGGLSEALRFTALRFTAANAKFRIDGAKLLFPEISITGENSAIEGRGEYSLDRKQLDFNGKVYPFQESGFLLKKLLDVALSPLSNVFEVKLTGTLEKPSWGLVLGPTNLLRNLSQTPEGTSPNESALPPNSPPRSTPAVETPPAGPR